MGCISLALLCYLCLLHCRIDGSEAAISQIPYACDPKQPHLSSFLFCNRHLPLSERAWDVVSRLSLEEKVEQLSNTAMGIPRLGIPPYQWWSESLHGLAPNGPGVHFGTQVPAATTFPQVILTTASFNLTLWSLIAQAVSTEARAMHNVGLAGLTYWSPNINIFRDPRWGRGQETPGEDPLVASHYTVAHVRGLQGQESGIEKSKLLKVSACCKHFIAYDLEKWHNFTRYTFNAQVTQQDMEDTYLPPFKSCIQDGQASCVMCSYNRVNGVPTCADKNFLVELIRKRWGLNGYITSDCDAVALLYEYIHYSPTPEDAAAVVLRAGLDLNCGSYLSNHTKLAFQDGKVSMFRIDEAVVNLFTMRMRLGLFDGDPKNLPYGDLGANAVCTKEHIQLALEAARQGIVLLKNDRNILPLSKQSVKMLLVVGPNGNASTDALLGDYSGIPCRYTTPLQGFQEYAEVVYHPGCKDVACNSDDLIPIAANGASNADAVILIVGLDQSQEREDHDRVSLLLPGKQEKLVSEVAMSSKGPVILIILSGGPVDVSFAKDSSKIQSILWAGYPGEAGGQALAEIIFGDYNPGGRLPVTWYPQSFTHVPMTDMSMRPDLSRGYPGRTYRFYTGETVYQFGYGLSYATYSHSFTSAPHMILVPAKVSNNPALHSIIDEVTCQGINFDIKVNIRNHGGQGGSHVVLLFSKSPSKHGNVPQKQLIAFERVHIEPDADVTVSFTISPCHHLTIVNDDGKRVLSLGLHTLIVDGIECPILLRTPDPGLNDIMIT